jgi:RNA-directed DNA polymerase
MPVGVGQLAFTFGFPEDQPKDEAQETQGDHPVARQPAAAPGRQPARKRKWHSLIDKVYALPNLHRAWERVQANQGAAGSDGMTIAKFAEGALERLAQLAQDLRAKTYRPQPVRRVFIPKSGGGQRPLGIPTVRDRIVQQAILQVLEPIFEAKFSPRSHGFRPGRGCRTALDVVDRAVRHGYAWVVDADLQRFFDTVDHEKLLDALNEEVADGSLLRLIRQILQAGVSLPATAEIEPTELGTPQGGPLSPLLANVYLHAFDAQVVAAGYGLVRYADDFVIFARHESEADAALELARTILEGQLGLVLHPEKTRVVSVAHGFEFLGYHYFHDAKRGVQRKEVRHRSVQRFRDAIRARTPRLRGQRRPKRRSRSLTLGHLQRNPRVGEIIRSVNRYLAGWHGYFRDLWSPFREPFYFHDCFVRRRLRSAITGRTGCGWWHNVLTNAVLGELGLRTLAERQAEYQAGCRAASARQG